MAGYLGLPGYLSNPDAPVASEEDELSRQIAADLQRANAEGQPFSLTIGQPQMAMPAAVPDKAQVVRDYLMQKIPTQADLAAAQQKAEMGSLAAGLAEAGGMIGSGFRSRPGEFNRAPYEGLRDFAQQPMKNLQQQAQLAEHNQRFGIEQQKELDRLSDRNMGAEFDDPNSGVTMMLLEGLRPMGIDPNQLRGQVTARQILKAAPGLKPAFSIEGLKQLENLKNEHKLGQMDKKHGFDKELQDLKTNNPWVNAKIQDIKTRTLKYIREMEGVQSPMLQLQDPNSPAPKGTEKEVYNGVEASMNILHQLNELEDIYKRNPGGEFWFGPDFKRAMIAAKTLVFDMNQEHNQKALTQGHQKLFQEMAPAINDLANVFSPEQFTAQLEKIRQDTIFKNNNAMYVNKYKPLVYDPESRTLYPPTGAPNARAMSGVADMVVGQPSALSVRPPPPGASPGPQSQPPAGYVPPPHAPEAPPPNGGTSQTLVAPPVNTPALNAQNAIEMATLTHKSGAVSKPMTLKRAQELMAKYPGTYTLTKFPYP